MPRKAKMRRPRRDPATTSISHVPPPLCTDDLVSASFRFTAASASSITVTRAILLNSLGFASSTTNLYRVIGAIRLRAVHIWSAPSANVNTDSTTEFGWNSPDTRPSVAITTSMGTSSISYTKHVPPKKSLVANWSISGSSESDALFTFNFNGGDVIQLDVTYQLQNAYVPSFTPTTITVGGTATAGYLYQLDLDHTNGTPKLNGQGRVSLA
jgi:hypothetical protein